jgi:hypothetical protein
MNLIYQCKIGTMKIPESCAKMARTSRATVTHLRVIFLFSSPNLEMNMKMAGIKARQLEKTAEI